MRAVVVRCLARRPSTASLVNNAPPPPVVTTLLPFAVAMAWAAPVYEHRSRSKRSTYAPAEDTHPVSRHSLTYCHSRPANSGSCSGSGLLGRPSTPCTAASTSRSQLSANPAEISVVDARVMCVQDEAQMLYRSGL